MYHPGQDPENSEPSSPSSRPDNDALQREIRRRAENPTRPLQPSSTDGPPSSPTAHSTEGQAANPYGTQANPASTPPTHGKRSSAGLAGLLVLSLLVGGLLGWTIGRTNTQAAGTGITNGIPGASLTQVAEKFRTSVVQINVQLDQGGSLGSGVIIDPRGYIVTNNHVIQGGRNYQVVLFDNTKLTAQVTGTDPVDDLAVVKINPPRGMTVAKIGDSSALNIGQPVLAIGNPLGITQTVTSGIVSALGRTVSEGNSSAVIIDAVQTDAAINPGNSGGALVDLQDELIGIPTLVAVDPEFKTPAAGVGFAIPSNRVKFIAQQIIKDGHVVNSGRADMGVQVINVDQEVASQLQLSVNHGALIVEVVSGGAAEKAGLQRGDVITQIDNTPINSVDELRDVLVNKSPGSTVSVRVDRSGQQKTVKVTLGALQIQGQ